MIDKLYIGGIVTDVEWVDGNQHPALLSTSLMKYNMDAGRMWILSRIPTNRQPLVLFENLMRIGAESVGLPTPVIENIEVVARGILSLIERYPKLLNIDDYHHYPELMVMGHRYTVHTGTSDVLTTQGLSGTHLGDQLEIWIAPDMETRRKCSVRFHELIHAIEHVHDVKSEERDVEAMEFLCISAIRQNPELVKQLQEVYHAKET